MHSLPSAIPGETDFDAAKSGLGGNSVHPKRGMTHNDSPVMHSMTDAERAKLQGGFSSQALGPTIIGYGPMLAEGNVVIEEWESQIYGRGGTLYNNQYLSLQRLENDQVVEFQEYNDTQHAAMTFGPLGGWPPLTPPTHPRRRNSYGDIAKAAALLPPDAIEEVFEVTDKFDLDPRLLVDVVPSADAPPVRYAPGVEGNKALVRGLRRALASGDQARVNSFYGKGFRQFIGGERPFGWDHLPRQVLYAPLVKHMATPLTLRFSPMVADETRVFEQMDSFARLDDGTVYNNWHALVHEIRGGKIVQTREYHDPRHMFAVLGRFAAWGANPPTPRSSPRRSNLQGIANTIQYATAFGPDLDRFKPFPPVA
jgi:ketosteroid isomerase-like protein